MNVGYIIWDFSGKLDVIGNFSINCYGLLFATGLALGGLWVYRRFRDEGMTDKDFEVFLIWGFVYVSWLQVGTLFFLPVGILLETPCGDFVALQDYG